MSAYSAERLASRVLVPAGSALADFIRYWHEAKEQEAESHQKDLAAKEDLQIWTAHHLDRKIGLRALRQPSW